MYCCSRVNFIYFGQAKSKITFKMWMYLWWSLKQFSMIYFSHFTAAEEHQVRFAGQGLVCWKCRITEDHLQHGEARETSSEPHLWLGRQMYCLTEPPQWYHPGGLRMNWNINFTLNCCQISDISHTLTKNLSVSHLVLQLSLCNILKPGVKSRMKM